MNTHSVVFHTQNPAGQANHDSTRMAVSQGVIHRLLGDMVQMSSSVAIGNQNRLVAFEAAGDLKEVLHFQGKLFQRAHKPQGVGENRQETA